MPNTVYSNFVLENKLEDQLTTKLNLSQLCTLDSSLTEDAGMLKKVHVYSGTGSVADVSQGVGNSADMTIAFTTHDYTVGVTQGRGVYYDEEALKDPFAIDSLMNYMAEAMANDFSSKVITAMSGATQIQYSQTFTFDNICDAIALFPEDDAKGGFLLINKAQLATLRKNLGEKLQYVEAFVRSGYVGTVCGFNVYVSNAVPSGDAYLGFADAVTTFVKKGVEVEQERDANLRKNSLYIRKVGLVALTRPNHIIKLTTAKS